MYTIVQLQIQHLNVPLEQYLENFNNDLDNKLTAFTVDVEVTAHSGIIGGFYGYINLTNKLSELNLPIIMIFPVSASKLGENGVNGIVGKYDANSVYSNYNAGVVWSLSAPSAGTYIVTFIAVLKNSK